MLDPHRAAPHAAPYVMLRAGAPLYYLRFGHTRSVRMANKYELPPLPYAYDALEPHIDEQTMRLHHDKHHLSYVNGLNSALEKLAAARQAGDFALVKHWSREAAFPGSGHLLHSIFWPNMAPAGSGPSAPQGALGAQIAKDFGSVDAFKAHFTAAAGAV